MVKKNIYLLLFVLVSQTMLSQSSLGGQYRSPKPIAPIVIPPSPEASQLMRFEEVPVSTYTGEPGISIPIVSKKLDNNLNVQLKLRYSTGGLKIDDRSSWTGTSWSLDGLGMVSRTVIDLPDDINMPKSVGTLYNGVFKFPDVEDINEFTWNAVNGNPSFDTELDLFQYNLLGSFGRFVLVKNEYGDAIEARSFDMASQHKINPIFNDDGIIISFQITDDAGYKYYFEDIESNTQSTSFHSVKHGSSGIESVGYSYISSWKMTKIESPYGFELMRVEYDFVLEKFRTEGVQTFVSYNGFIGFPLLSDFVFAPGLRSTTRSNTSHRVSTKKPSKIIFRDGTYITLARYGGGHPEYPVEGSSQGLTGTKLKEVALHEADDTVVDKAVFSYSTTVNKRLFLTEIKKGISSDDELSYVMTYNQEDKLPEYGSDKKDGWGYYRKNGVFDSGDPTIGCLTSITYPQGGKKEFTFEQHTFSMIGDQMIDPKDIRENYIPVSFYSNFSATNNSSSPTTGIIFVSESGRVSITQSRLELAGVDTSFYSVKLSSVTPLRYLGQDCIKPACTEYDVTVNDFKINTDGFSKYYSLQRGTKSTYVPAGWYFVTLEGDGGPAPFLTNHENSASVDLHLSYEVYDSVNPTFNMVGAGFRIKEIKFTDKGQVKDHTIFDYNKFGETTSSGSFDGDLYNSRKYYLTENLVIAVADQIPAPLSQYQLHSPFPMQYIITETSNNRFSQLTKGSYVGYQNASMYKPTNGRTEYTYTFPGDYPSRPPALGSPFQPVPDIDFKRGLLIKQEVFSQDNKKLQLTTNRYSFKEEVVARSWVFEKGLIDNNNCAIDVFYTSYDDFLDTTPRAPLTGGSDESVSIFAITSIDCGLLFEDGKQVFDEYGNPVPHYRGASAYPYNHISGLSLMLHSETTNYFADDVKSFRFRTTQDYFYESPSHYYRTKSVASGDQGETLVTKIKYPQDMIGHPDEPPFMSDLVAANRVTTPVEVKTYKSNIPITVKIAAEEELLSTQSTSYGLFSGLVLPRGVKTAKGGDALEDRVVYHKYDSYGNPLEVSQAGGAHTSYIWGYMGQYPVAKIENSTYDTIPVSLREAIITASDTGTEAQLQVALNNLRNHTALHDAMITTITYRPTIGVTTMTDPRGYTISYEYDDFNRLEYVRDADGNIVNRNEYNYKN